MGNIKRDKIELLAPAGGMEQFVAAVENGADAIYIGGKNFNARMNASNFDLKQMKEKGQTVYEKDGKEMTVAYIGG